MWKELKMSNNTLTPYKICMCLNMLIIAVITFMTKSNFQKKGLISSYCL